MTKIVMTDNHPDKRREMTDEEFNNYIKDKLREEIKSLGVAEDRIEGLVSEVALRLGLPFYVKNDPEMRPWKEGTKPTFSYSQRQKHLMSVDPEIKKIAEEVEDLILGQETKLEYVTEKHDFGSEPSDVIWGGLKSFSSISCFPISPTEEEIQFQKDVNNAGKKGILDFNNSVGRIEPERVVLARVKQIAHNLGIPFRIFTGKVDDIMTPEEEREKYCQENLGAETYLPWDIDEDKYVWDYTGQVENEAKVYKLLRRARCDKAENGYYCQRWEGHDGPCAPVPTTIMPMGFYSEKYEYTDKKKAFPVKKAKFIYYAVGFVLLANLIGFWIMLALIYWKTMQ